MSPPVSMVKRDLVDQHHDAVLRDRFDALAARTGCSADAAREVYEERAAIRQYEGGATKADAEALAWRDVLDLYDRQGDLLASSA